MQAGIVPVKNLVGLPPHELIPFGGKTAGYVRLLSLQSASPYPYNVPDAWAIPARSQGSFSQDDVRTAFEGLVRGMTEPGVLMARSSALAESPGQNPTFSTAFDPSRKEDGWARFRQAAERLLDSSPDMGVLATTMVGTLSLLKGGLRAFGWENVSFVADTHNPTRSSEIYVAAVHGLGTQAVKAGTDPILIIADRDNGHILHVGNQSERFIRTFRASIRWVEKASDYRQKQADFFSFDQGVVASQALCETDFEGLPQLMLVDGTLYVDREAPRRRNSISPEWGWFRDQGQRGAIQVGMTPFRKPKMTANLIGVLQYLAAQIGPVQIEGAFPTGSTLTPSLYQLLEVPILEPKTEPLSIRRPHLRSDLVIGSAHFNGRLVYVDWLGMAGDFRNFLEELKDLDRGYGETSYILLAHHHTAEMIEATPHCRYRLSLLEENVTSHAVTETRLKIARDRDAGHMLAMRVKGDVRKGIVPMIGGVPPDLWLGNLAVYYNARLESNGFEMGIELRNR